MGPAFCRMRQSSGRHVEIGGVDARSQVGQRVRRPRRGPPSAGSAGLAAERLSTAPSGARLPRRAISAPCSCCGACSGRMTSCQAGHAKGRHQLLAEGRAGHRQRIELQLFAQGLHDDRHAAGAIEVFHVGCARGLESDEHGRALADVVEALQLEMNAEPASDGGQVDDGVGGAADGLQHAQGVVEGRVVHDARGSQAAVREGHGLDAAALSVALAFRVHGGDGCAARQHHAQGLAEAGHGAGGAHHAAGAGGGRQLLLDVVDGRALQLTAAVSGPEAAAIGAGADAFALVAAGEHGAGGEHDGGAGSRWRRPSAGPAGSCRSHP